MDELSRQPNLLRAIVKDLWRNKQHVFLMLLAVASAFCVVWTTHHTRMLVEQRESLMMTRDGLNVEWRHLLIEQNALAEHSRVESIAKKRLGMHRPKIEEQVVITN